MSFDEILYIVLASIFGLIGVVLLIIIIGVLISLPDDAPTEEQSKDSGKRDTPITRQKRGGMLDISDKDLEEMDDDYFIMKEIFDEDWK